MKYFIFLIINLLLINVLVNAAFQTSIFRETNDDFIGENVCVSPLSIFQVLGLTTNGGKGETQEQMVSALEANSLENLNSINLNILQTINQFETVELANGVMTTFEPTKMFLKMCIKYEAAIEPLISVDQVNEWCEEKTHGKITKILDELQADTSMLLLNAVYFNATWQHKFEHSDTYPGDFYVDSTVKKKVDFMHQTTYFKYYEDNSVQVVELPYTKDSTSAIVILPKEKTDLNTYLKSLDDEVLNTMLAGLSSKRVRLSLPKFQIEFKNKYKGILMRLGMIKAFKTDADFRNLRCYGGIFVNDVIHKTFLKVDEDGTEAAAVTIVEMLDTALPPTNLVIMNVNRPFIFLIRSTKLPKNNDLLFMAKVVDI